MKFEDLNLDQPLLRALADEGYAASSPIQKQAIPLVLEGRDLLACAQTGTGKTAAFAVPMLQLLSRKKPEQRRVVRSLVLTPTRELAVQICNSFKTYGKYLNLRTTVLFGGVSQVPQVTELRRGVDILVATPGRLNDLIQQGLVDLSQVEIFVLDEADRMLDMGFIHDVNKIISNIPKKRQTLFFSATMPKAITELVHSILTNPAKVTVTPVSSTVDTIQQTVYHVDKKNKIKLLTHLLQDQSIVSALVFTRTKYGADRVVKDLNKSNIKSLAIHGDKSQNARQLALENFKKGAIRVLVATDIAARGIDIDELSHVFNYDLPNISETYVHRIGRTGRAGLSGVAISFCDYDEKEYLDDIEKLIKKQIPLIRDQPYPMAIFESTPKQTNPRPRRFDQATSNKPRSSRPRQSDKDKKDKKDFSYNKKKHGKPTSNKPTARKAPPRKG